MINKKYSIFIATIVLCINILMFGNFNGFVVAEEIGFKQVGNLFVSGSSGYSYFADRHFLAILAIVSFIFGKWLRNEFFSLVICVASVGSVIFIAFEIYFVKQTTIANTANAEYLLDYYKFLRETLPIDRIWMFLVLSLLSMQVFDIYSRIKDKSRTENSKN
jgi:hypothetical protein